MEEWLTNWGKFVEEVARCFTDGMDNDQLTERFAGNEVTWSGKIRNVELGQEYANGIALDMPDIKIRLLDGRLLIANYVFLLVEPTQQESWNKLLPGQAVTFKATIKKPDSIFPEVQVSVSSNDPEVILMLGMENAQPV